MELNQLRYFYEVARQGSFTKASRTLRISQPSLSKMIRKLEEVEGYRFLDREKRGVRLTPMGALLYEGCERVFEELRNVKRAIENRKDECNGELWLGASDNLCNYVFPETLASFQNKFPNVSIKLFSGVASEITTQLKDFRLELGIFYTPVSDSALSCERLSFVEFGIFAAPGLVRNLSWKKALSELGYIGSLRGDYSKPYPALEMLSSLDFTPRLRLETNSQETQKRLAVQGLGFTVLPLHMVRESEPLVRIPVPKKIGTHIYLVKRRNRTLSRPSELWVAHLVEVPSSS